MPVIDIGGVNVGLKGSLRDEWIRRYKTFFTPRSSDYSLEVSIIKGWFPFYLFNDIPTLHRKNGCLHILGRGLKGSLDLRKKRGDIQCWQNIFSFDTLLRVIYSGLLVESDGVLLHSCGMVAPGNKGIIFIGPSESGKTTLSTLSMENLVLSDEMIAVRKKEGVFFIHSTPFRSSDWWKDRDVKAMAPLNTLFFIEKGDKIICRELSRKKAVVLLLQNVLSFSKNRELALAFLDLFATMVEKIPCYSLTFTKDTRFWNEINDVLR